MNGKVAADRTTQRLCDDTRAQYELLLQRQETNYERQLQTAHTKLQDVLDSSISLVEHEKLLIAEGQRNHRERDQLLLEHAHEMKQLDAKWQEQWEMSARELKARFEDEKQRLRDQIPPLELARDDAFRLLKEQEIDQLTWSQELHKANRARELAETRLDEACKHLLSLKAQLKALALLRDALDAEKEKHKVEYDKCQQEKLQMAEMKGEWSRQTAMLEKDVIETVLAESRTKEQLLCESRDAGRTQFQKERDDLQAALASQRVKLEQARQRLTALEQHAHKSDAEKQELETKLAMTTRFHGDAEAKWRQRKKELQTRVTQLKHAMKTLRTQTQELQRDDELARLLFPH
uniref:Uncharacterized protein n=1 Tax=Globisporangium ultimum (strain ATCC 200006 / CBS 805.95 / DAOM BR144) TaxID=431595 RepID=K3WV73_GLOUD